MLRSLLSLSVVLALVAVTEASTIKFVKDIDGGSNVFTIIGDGSFTLADTPWYQDAESTRYLATSSNFKAQVTAFGTGPIIFDMYDAHVWPTFNALTLELRNPDHGALWINIPQVGLVHGQQVPTTLPGPNYWKAHSVTDPSGVGPLLGTLPNSYLTAVPEPASIGALASGLLSLLALRRRR